MALMTQNCSGSLISIRSVYSWLSEVGHGIHDKSECSDANGAMTVLPSSRSSNSARQSWRKHHTLSLALRSEVREQWGE